MWLEIRGFSSKKYMNNQVLSEIHALKNGFAVMWDWWSEEEIQETPENGSDDALFKQNYYVTGHFYGNTR